MLWGSAVMLPVGVAVRLAIGVGDEVSAGRAKPLHGLGSGLSTKWPPVGERSMECPSATLGHGGDIIVLSSP